MAHHGHVIPSPAPLAVAPSLDVATAVALVLLVALAAGVSAASGLGVTRTQVTAAARAALQLAVVAVVVGAVLRSLLLASLFVLVMLLVAAATSARRMAVPATQLPWAVLAVAAGVAPVLAVTLLLDVLPLNPVGVLPYAGIVIGGAMSAATLTGRRAAAELEALRPQYEAALALGLSGREATALVLEPHAAEGLVPGIDQTRTVGLVTLPGAFVGVLLGGGSATDAASAQLLVLVGLLAAQAVTAAVVLWLVAGRRLVRTELLRALPT